MLSRIPLCFQRVGTYQTSHLLLLFFPLSLVIVKPKFMAGPQCQRCSQILLRLCNINVLIGGLLSRQIQSAKGLNRTKTDFPQERKFCSRLTLRIELQHGLFLGLQSTSLPREFGLASLYYHLSQFLKINLFL